MSPTPLSLPIGLVAGTLTTLAFIPQVVRSWRRRSVGDLSLTMLLAFAMGVALWIAYGLMTEALPVIVSNAVTLVLALALIVMKWRFRKGSARAPEARSRPTASRRPVLVESQEPADRTRDRASART